MKTFSERLKFALSQTDGGTQANLARHCKVKPSSVSEWFNGRSKSMGGSQLLLAAEYLDVNAKWLIDGIGLMKPSSTPANSHKVMEEVSVYVNTDWPFKTITQEEWNGLPNATRKILEQQIKSLVSTHTRQKIRA